ncbi:HlyD family type I secretion periplasmic adaptor subunit [Tsuneonella deserti]|uniref:Membrane fusion protein (MFP) family protein n=1 Tax=Tsuneonella deserti TaxID=2035528 RepID=A0ABQ1SA91_9SPHN|nr:HlyD family type I secretion periplasmic adaptor subunit [Tsuneonella deserti]
MIAPGRVGVEDQVKRVAHPTGGVIAEILVQNGQHVSKGQLLMRLEDTVSGAADIYSSMTVEQLLAQRARLEAERLGANRISFPRELTTAANGTAREAMANEAKLFALRRSEERQLQAQLRARITQSNQQIRSYRAQIASLVRQQELIRPELAGVRDLWAKELVTINRLNELERTQASLEGNISSLEADIARVGAQITESNERLIQLGESRRAEAATALAQLNTQLNDQRVRNVSAGDQQANREIRAPYSGTIEKVAFAAVGDVVRPAEPIMEIVPDAGAMVVEAMVRPEDVDRLQTGQAARTRFTSFSRAATPEFAGRVTYVASDRTVDPEANVAFFMARVSIDAEAVRREGLDLRSGMPAEVYIETGSRPLVSYLGKPLRDQLARAFRYD